MSDLFMDMLQKRLQQTAAAAAKTTTTTYPKQTAASFQSNSSTTKSSTSNSTQVQYLANGSAKKTDSTADASASIAADDDVDDDDEFANILSLKLKKPQHWKWELTTSRSCSNIALPRILLYDHKGELLVDADSQEEKVYKQKAQTDSNTRKRTQRKRTNKAATSNLAQCIRQALDREFNGLQIQEATPSPTTISPARSIYRRQSSAAPSASTTSAIDFYTNELPDYKFERRSSSLKGVRFKGVPAAATNANESFDIGGLPTPPSTTHTSTTTPTTASSSSGAPQEKRRYRRSHSSGRSPAHSESILERFSFNRGRFSSPEHAEEVQLYRPPRYFLRTSKAGTLVVQEESFSRYRRRCKPKNSSSETTLNNECVNGNVAANLLQATKLPTHMPLPAPQNATLQSHSLQNITEKGRRKTLKPIRRYCSDGNVLLHRQLSTSEEEAELEQMKNKKMLQGIVRKHIQEKADSVKELNVGQQKNYAKFGRQNKRDLVTLNGENGIMSSMERPTRR